MLSVLGLSPIILAITDGYGKRSADGWEVLDKTTDRASWTGSEVWFQLRVDTYPGR